jgi:hypothetical protein
MPEIAQIPAEAALAAANINISIFEERIIDITSYFSLAG